MRRVHKGGATPEAFARSLARGFEAGEIREVRNIKGEQVLRKVPLWKAQSEAQKNYLRFLELSVRYAQNNVPPAGKKRHNRQAKDQRPEEGQEAEAESIGITPDNPYTKLDATDRMIARSVTEKMLRLIELRAAQAKEDQQPPDA